ncbi:DUF1217 domain-containing protein [Pseudotabrizicola sp. L79]|uniref:DUF1217 domain-containing protein n=1 Tax=Pseudotabrizicola sp. L79 TaxID=3118402 RepID=UPI002F9409B0
MTFNPILPTSGYAGWTFLKRTEAQQTQAFANQTSVKREEAYFREKIGTISSADALVADPRLLRVALTAYGLEADMPNKFFIKKILTDGTLSTTALANRMTDKSYVAFSKAFGFGDFSTPRTKLSDFADKLLLRYREKQFQSAVGEQNSDFRLAMNAETQLGELAASSASDKSKWYTVLGSSPMRKVFEVAFGLPSSFAGIDIDKQVEVLQARTRSTFGADTISQFTDEESMQKLVRLFIVRSEVASLSSNASGAQTALTLLQQTRFQTL